MRIFEQEYDIELVVEYCTGIAYKNSYEAEAFIFSVSMYYSCIEVCSSRKKNNSRTASAQATFLVVPL